MALLHRGVHRLGYARIAVKDSRFLKTRELHLFQIKGSFYAAKNYVNP